MTPHVRRRNPTKKAAIAMPTVDDLAVSVFTIPTEDPESDGTLTWNATTVVVVEPTAAGATGIGFSYATAACARLIDDVLREAVVGRDAFDVPGSWSAMVRSIRNFGRPGIASMAIAAVDCALWDLKAKIFDVSLVKLLGQVHDTVPVYGSGGFTSYSNDELARQFNHWVHEQGIPRVKMKVRESWGSRPERDLERVPFEWRRRSKIATSHGSRNRCRPITFHRWHTCVTRPESTSRRVSTATTCSTSKQCARRRPSTVSKPTRRGVPASASGCGWPLLPNRTDFKSPDTARSHCTHTQRARWRTFVISSTSPTTHVSIDFSLTAFSIPWAASCVPISLGRDSASNLSARTHRNFVCTSEL